MVLLDLKMPRRDGMDVLRELKADPEFRNVPVVMMTSSKEERDVVESYRLGVNAYVGQWGLGLDHRRQHVRKAFMAL